MGDMRFWAPTCRRAPIQFMRLIAPNVDLRNLNSQCSHATTCKGLHMACLAADNNSKQAKRFILHES